MSLLDRNPTEMLDAIQNYGYAATLHCVDKKFRWDWAHKNSETGVVFVGEDVDDAAMTWPRKVRDAYRQAKAHQNIVELREALAQCVKTMAFIGGGNTDETNMSNFLSHRASAARFAEVALASSIEAST